MKGLLHERWSSWFDGLEITSEPDEVTLIAGPVTDQAALHGLLAKIRDLDCPDLGTAHRPAMTAM